MDAAAAKARTQAEIDRKNKKFMRNFDRWVKNAARKGNYSVEVEVSHPLEKIEHYATHLRSLGYRVWESPTGMLLRVDWGD